MARKVFGSMVNQSWRFRKYYYPPPPRVLASSSSPNLTFNPSSVSHNETRFRSVTRAKGCPAVATYDARGRGLPDEPECIT